MKLALFLKNALLLIFVLCSLVTSCKRQENQPIQESCVRTPKPDSTITVYPDTAYQSVENLDFTIQYMDSSISGEITNLQDLYAHASGILSFRGGPYRDANFQGKITGTPHNIEIDWIFRTDYDTIQSQYGTWGGGTGWTGQPLYVHWSDSLFQRFKKMSPALTSSFGKEEIIVGSLCGKVYFINYQTGDSSRRAFNVDNTIKGTPSLDPTFNGNLYIGQGIPLRKPFGALVMNLFTHQKTHFFAEDPKAWRRWDAYDSSPIVVGNFMFRLGENGTIYKYLIKNGNIEIHSTMRYKVKGKWAAGIESSLAIYANYGYFSDNHGNIICFNLNTLQPVWHYNNHDDSDATPVIEVENGTPYLYSGCEVDKQGEKGYSYFVKINGLNGKKIWEDTISCQRAFFDNKWFDGGIFATPLPGKGNCQNLIFVNVCTHFPLLKGDLVAIDKQTGKIIYRVPLKHYAWSSPVAIYNEKNELFIFTGDTAGNVYLIDGKSGKIITTRYIGNNFESSPIVIDNHVVIGSRGREIYKLSIL
ncbi:MAG: dehydrogenase [Bacteroidales bacterium]|nr:dehydrogenase [Bacteroidales bacterium]